jgi:hypothetical protein
MYGGEVLDGIYLPILVPYLLAKGFGFSEIFCVGSSMSGRSFGDTKRVFADEDPCGDGLKSNL